jgi:hypothetical protein
MGTENETELENKEQNSKKLCMIEIFPSVLETAFYLLHVITYLDVPDARNNSMPKVPRLHDKYFGHGTLKFRHADL